MFEVTDFYFSKDSKSLCITNNEFNYTVMLSLKNSDYNEAYELSENCINGFMKRNSSLLQDALKGELSDQQIRTFGADCVREVSRGL